MSSDISVYSFRDADGDESGTYRTQDFEKAKEYASEHGLLIIDNVYEWTEAIPVEYGDYRKGRALNGDVLDEFGECDEDDCERIYALSDTTDHCAEEGKCWEHCTNRTKHWQDSVMALGLHSVGD